MRPGAWERQTSAAQPGITALGWVLSSRAQSSGEWPRWAQRTRSIELNGTTVQEPVHILSWWQSPWSARTSGGGQQWGSVGGVGGERQGEGERAEAARSSRHQLAGKDEDGRRDQTVCCSALLNHLLCCPAPPLSTWLCRLNRSFRVNRSPDPDCAELSSRQSWRDVGEGNSVTWLGSQHAEDS